MLEIISFWAQQLQWWLLHCLASIFIKFSAIDRGKVRNLYEIFNEIARNFVLLLLPWSWPDEPLFKLRKLLSHTLNYLDTRIRLLSIKSMAEFWFSQIFMEVSRFFSLCKLVVCKSSVYRDFPFDYFFWMNDGRIFPELYNVMLFPDTGGFEWGPISSKYCLSYVPQFWKPSRMQRGILPAALQQPMLFCRIGLCPCQNWSNPA